MSVKGISQPAVALGGNGKQRSARMLLGISVAWLVLAGIALSTLFPLLFLVATALRTPSDYTRSPGGIPEHLTLANIEYAIHKVELGRLAVNSLLVVVPSVALLVLLSCLSAFALTQLDFPFRRGTLVIVVALMAVPPTVILIPVFKVVLEAGLLNERLGLVLVYTALNLPFSIFLLAAFMRSIPKEILVAARVDGASNLRTLWSVVLPLVKPGLLTLVTLDFLVLWNEFLFSLVILQKEDSRTIMVGVAQLQGRLLKNFGVLSAGLLLSMIPPLIIFLFFQRDLARGLTAGSVK